MKINPRFKDKRASDSLSSFSTVSLYKKKVFPLSLSPWRRLRVSRNFAVKFYSLPTNQPSKLT